MKAIYLFPYKSESIPKAARSGGHMFLLIGSALLMLLLFPQSGYAQISGKVFRDFNGNGARDSSAIIVEIGVPGLIVTVTDGISSASATTSTFGDYSFPNSGITASGKPLRVIFSNLPSGDFSGPQGTFSGTSVQFVTAGSTAKANFGFNYPAQYCQASPLVTSSCFVSGKPQTGSEVGLRYVLVSLPFAATGDPAHNNLSRAQELGSVMGLAYQKSENKIYSAAFTKRHVGYGPGGPGAIYVSSLSANQQSTTSNTLFFNFGTRAGTDLHDANLPTTSSSLVSRENNVFDAVGKVGLGDMDISDDEKSLYVVNLFNRKLYKLDIATKDTVGYAIPNPCATGTSYRPFAVKYYRGKVYVGVVCSREDATTKTDTVGMSATVYQFEAGTFTSVLSFPLTYKKQPSNADLSGVDRAEYWRPWTATYRSDREPGTGTNGPVSYPQPWLADIEFDINGDMLLGIRDRFGDQMGYQNYKPFVTTTNLYSAISPGEILRAGKCTLADVWSIEQNGAVCGGTPSTAQNNQQGPGGGKYYFGDQVGSSANHGASSMGGLAVLAGSGKVIMTAIDPTDVFNTGGIKRLINKDGSKDGGGGASGGATLYLADAFSYGKANGLGDIELLCNVAPIEIGNRVWLDQDNDGIQDPGEVGISGLTVTLCLASAPTVAVATATTDANGSYYFSTAAGTSTASVKYGLNLTYNTDYILKFPVTSAGQPLAIKDLGGNDMIDSDAAANGTIAFTTGDLGQNNHTFDVGYSACIKPAAVPTPKNQTICAGEVASAYTVIPSAGVQYQWYGPLADTTSTLGTAIGGATVATFTPTGGQVPASGLRYFAVVVNTTGDLTCADTAFVSLQVNVKPDAGQDISICAPTTTATLTGFTPQGGTWAALPGNPALAAVTNAGEVSGLSATGTYSFVYSLNGCTDTVAITVKPKPVIALDGSAICAPDLLTYSVPFTVTVGATVTTNKGTVSGNTVTGVASGETVEIYADLDGCKDTLTVTFTCDCPLVSPPVVSATASSICVGESSTLSATGCVGGTTRFYSDAGLTTEVTNLVVSPTVTTTYYAVCTITVNGCKSQAAEVTVTVKPLPTPTVNSPSICAGESATLTVSNCAGTVIWNDTTTGLTKTVSPAITTTYTATCTVDGCSGNAIATVTVKPKPTITVTATTCTIAGTSYDLTFSATAGATVTADKGTVSGSSVTGIPAGQTVKLIVSLDGCTDSTTAVQNCTIPTGSLGDFVWKDLNDNGQQDNGEPGVNDVKVVLWSAVGGLPTLKLDSVLTSGNGGYSFTNLLQGDYIVQLDLTTLPDSCLISTKPNTGDDATDSDFNLAGFSPVVSIDPLQTGLPKNNPTIDAALYSPKGSIGNFVWKDLNNNGRQDAGEPGVNGVKVTLYLALGGLPGTAIDSMLTANRGIYTFTNLPKGDYIIKIDLTTLPDSCLLSTNANAAGVPDSLDSDFGPSGLSPVVSIDPVVPGLSQNNPTIDAALYSPKGSIGDFVWKDLNDNGQQDSGEPGVNGVKVVLWSAVGGLPSVRLDSTLTSGNGGYSFTNLLKGDYLVQIDLTSLPDTCIISTKPNTGDDATDSDFTTAGLSPVVSLDPTGTGLTKDNPTLDAGLYSPCVTPGVGVIFAVPASCFGKTANSDASFTISAVTNSDRYSVAATADALVPYASATVINGSTVTMNGLPNPASGLGTTYYIRLYNGRNGCFKDTTVLIPFSDCNLVCVKPNAGADVFICNPSTGTDLPDALSYEEWVVGSQNPTAATINASTGVVSGLTTSGVYSFILRDTALIGGCSDTVYVFRGVTDLPAQTTCFDTLKLPAVAGAIYSKAAGNPASITASGFITGLSEKGMSYDFIISNGICADTITVTRLNCDKVYDLALNKTIDKKVAMLGDVITYTIRVWNEGEATAHGISVTDSLNAGVQYVSSTANVGSYSSMTKLWRFDSLAVGDTATLTIDVRVIGQGVWFNTAEISGMTEEDTDSTPGNGTEGEDDIDHECFTVPLLLCRGQGAGVNLAVPAEYTGVVWFRKTQNGQPVQVGTGNTYIATETELGSYEYTFTSTSGTCPAEGCCPILIAVQDCCPAEVCVPFVITRNKK